MIIRFFLCFATLWIGHLALGQVSLPLLSDLGVDRQYYMIVPNFNPLGQVKGTPYYDETWRTGRILLQNGRIVEGRNLLYRFDAYNNVLTVKDGTERVIALSNEGIQWVELKQTDDEVVRLKKVKWDDKEKPVRLVRTVFENDAMELVQDVRKTYYQPTAQEHSAYAPDAKMPRFDEKYAYFVRHGTGAFEKISLKRSNIVELLPEAQRAAATAFCKEKGYKGTLEEKEALTLLQQFFMPK